MSLPSGRSPFPEVGSPEDVETTLAARVRARFPQVTFTKTRLLLDGWDMIALEADDRLIFRFPRRAEVLPGLAQEMRLLPLLVNLPVRTPQYRWVAYPDQLDHLGQFGGYEKIQGEALRRDHLHPELVSKISKFLASLHSLPAEIAWQAGLPYTSPDTWIQEYRDLFTLVQHMIFPRLSSKGQASAARLWDHFLEESSRAAFPITLIHRDLDAGHVLVADSPAVLSGVIDWGDAALGDPALDFVGFYWIGGECLVRDLLVGYPLELGASFWERVVFYQNLGPYYLALFGLQSGDQARAEEGIRGIEDARYESS